MQQGIFYGEQALSDFLDPRNHHTPLLELPKDLNPFYNDGISIFLKLQTFLPLGNIKSISARGMLEDAQKQGILDHVEQIVESSSGNTAISLAVLGKNYGIPRMRAWISNEITDGKLKFLQLLGIQGVVNQEQICPNPNDTTSGIYKAHQEGQQAGRYNPDQYHNPANPSIHYEYTGPELRNQLSQLASYCDFRFFCAGLGTTGTFIGISTFLKEKKSDISCIGVVRKPNNPIPGPRTHNLLRQIGFDRKQNLDALEEIGSKQAYEMSLQLLRRGIMVGPSAGMALCGLFAHLHKLQGQSVLPIGEETRVGAVVVCPDSPYPYLDEYVKYCDASCFLLLENDELLTQSEISYEGDSSYQLRPEQVFSMVYATDGQKNSIKKSESSFFIQPDWVLIDLRSISAFEHVHLPCSLSLPFKTVSEKDFLPYKEKNIVLICAFGGEAAYRAMLLRKSGYKAFYLEGGLIERSDQKLPRIVHQSCSL